MMKYKIALVSLLFFGGFFANAQYKYEREHRIKKSQFPPAALQLIENNISDVKRFKYYKETDSIKTSFEAKLKKDKLWYSMGFDENGILNDIKIVIKPVDIPSETLQRINAYLENSFTKYKVKRLMQQYPYDANEELEATLRNAFQNLLLPSINYKYMVKGKKEKGYLDYEILFDAEGNFKNHRKMPPPNFDHVLY
ncbi:hypothetical protein [Maribacter thermophilus]|uniref:hypothetical protein n=1 Tax=Maribacter thermophilus TaxID=1197874 RepID=UPI000AD7E16D|nr:hypothetical protein [Maribacter thermophilus]